jgi:hypothetical protein
MPGKGFPGLPGAPWLSPGSPWPSLASENMTFKTLHMFFR